MSIENKIIGGMTPEEFRLKAKEVADWIKGFCRFGRDSIDDEEEYLVVMMYIAIALTSIAEVSDTFTDLAEEYAKDFIGDKKIEVKMKPSKHKS